MIPLDKLAHALAGAVIVLALGYVAPLWVAFVVAWAVAALKECYDSWHPLTHTADKIDALATTAGAISAAGFIYLVRLL